jgi:FMN phosphatase YigB (HAD superfamily)
MKYLNKTYKTIIWDWKSTLYDANNAQLYNWVLPFFKNNDVNHIMVSWALNPDTRTELIKNSDVNKYFSKVYVTNESKRAFFVKILNDPKIEKESVIVIGDNVNDEIALAKELGIDTVEVNKFVKIMNLQN